MKQTRIMSFVESIINIAIGFGISVGAQAIFLPMLGLQISLGQNLSFAVIMTVISIARQFILRRLFEALHIRRPLSPFMNACIAERFRQIEAEGWDSAHDDIHVRGQLAEAGGCYLLYAGNQVKVPIDWPWEDSWWKPRDFRRDLVRGVALGIAEGEKYDRERKPKPRRIK